MAAGGTVRRPVGAPPCGFEVQGKLGGVRGLSAALKAAHQNDARLAIEVQAVCPPMKVASSSCVILTRS